MIAFLRRRKSFYTAFLFSENYRYPGQYFDTESGLHYNYHRYYDPAIGRYLRADPIGLAGMDSNLYGYVRNNPVNLIDLFGLRDSKYGGYGGPNGWRKFSIAISATGGPPSGITNVPIPWKQYRDVGWEVGKVAIITALDYAINRITSAEIPVIDPELLKKLLEEMDPTYVPPAEAFEGPKEKCQ